jgi:hypothetical protein
MYCYTPNNEAVASILVMCNENALDPILEKIESAKRGVASDYIQKKIDSKNLTEMDFLFEYSQTGKVANLFDTNSSIDNCAVHDLRIHADYCYSNGLLLQLDTLFFGAKINEQSKCKILLNDGLGFYGKVNSSSRLVRFDSLHLVGLKHIWMYLLRYKTAKKLLPIMGLDSVMMLYSDSFTKFNSDFLDFEYLVQSQIDVN